MGVIAPLISNAKDAKELEGRKISSEGERGVGFGRSHGYGFNFNEYMDIANEEYICMCSNRTYKRSRKFDEIFTVKGIDAA